MKNKYRVIRTNYDPITVEADGFYASDNSVTFTKSVNKAQRNTGNEDEGFKGYEYDSDEPIAVYFGVSSVTTIGQE